MEKLTQQEKIIRHLKKFKTISSWQAYSEYGITQLAARIFELKNKGYKFIMETRYSRNRFGEKVHYTQYSLKESENNEKYK